MDEEYYMQIPSQQKFYRIFATTLNIIGFAKRMWWGYKPIHGFLHFHGKFLVQCCPIVPISQLVHLYLNYGNLPFEIVGTIFCILPISILININVASTRMGTYKSLMKNFMSKVHISNARSRCIDISDYMKQTVIFVERITRYTAYYLIFFYGLNCVFWFSTPIVHNIINKEKIINKTMQLETCVYLWMPFDYAYSFKNWIIIQLFNFYLVPLGVLIMAMLHCLNYIFIYHLIGHIHILKHIIKSSFIDTSKLSDEEIKNRLAEIIEYHSFILRVLDDVQTAFGMNVAANYLHNLVSDSLILYQVLNGGDIFSYSVMVGAYMGELILMSFVTEEIRKQSEDLPDVVYSVPWENMSISNQKIFILILSRVQIELQFVALGGMKAGVQPMIAILKTTFSYYVMLKSSLEDT